MRILGGEIGDGLHVPPVIVVHVNPSFGGKHMKRGDFEALQAGDVPAVPAIAFDITVEALAATFDGVKNRGGRFGVLQVGSLECLP